MQPVYKLLQRLRQPFGLVGRRGWNRRWASVDREIWFERYTIAWSGRIGVTTRAHRGDS